jgi:carboxyl-terminal processing protease
MKSVVKSFLAVALLSSSFAFGFAWKDIKKGESPLQRNLQAGIISTPKDALPGQVFRKTFSHIKSSYSKKTDITELKYSAMEGLVASLGDPHSNFFVPKINNAFKEDTKGRFYGIGARLMPDPLGVKVTSVFEDGTAAAAGVKAGDIIIAVNDVVVAGKESDDIVTMIKGEEGTEVRIRILRGTTGSPIDFRLTRKKVTPPSVESKFVADSQVGYIKIIQFTLETPEQFDKALDTMDASKPKGLVIDLRDNPGGALDAAVKMLSRFVEDTKIVTLKYRGGDEEVTNALVGNKRDFGYPIVVLVNEDSASAAEIMSGVLKDYGKATLVGERTYGKFSVQTIFPLVDSSGIKLTIARYYLPKSGSLSRKVDDDGKYISGGIQPDVKVDLDDDSEFEAANVKKDAQFARAVEVIQGR